MSFAFTTDISQVNLADWGTGTYIVELDVTAEGNTVSGYAAQLVRVGSDCSGATILATAASQSGTGLKTFTFNGVASSDLASDRFQVRILGSVGGGNPGARTLDIEVNTTDSEVLVPWVASPIPDSDGDGVYDIDEANCGGDSLNAAIRPERLDGAFAGVDDDGDTAIDEALPGGSAGFDCDGDGWSGSDEMLIFSAGTTANDQDPCGNNGWPADLHPHNILDIGDVTSYLFPAGANDGHLNDAISPGFSFNYFAHTVPDAGRVNEERWNIDPGFNGVIDIGDLTALNPAVTATTARPPMFGGAIAFFEPACPWPP